MPRVGFLVDAQRLHAAIRNQNTLPPAVKDEEAAQEEEEEAAVVVVKVGVGVVKMVGQEVETAWRKKINAIRRVAVPRKSFSTNDIYPLKVSYD